MTTYTYILDRSDKKKNPCPGCGRTGVFRPYIHHETGEPAGDQYGICDRLNNCGYVLYPSYEGEMNDYQPPPPKLRNTSWRCPQQLVDMTQDHRDNTFAHWLVSIYGEPAKEVLRKYRVGTYPISEKNPHLSGAMVFWQVDEKGEYRSGKIIPYGSDGKRIKSMGSSWVHSVVYGKSMDELGIGQVLFGSHLLDQDKPVAIVESEKTALICAILYPCHIWLATGGASMISLELFMPLAGRNVTLFPDAGPTYSLWLEKIADIEPMMASLTVSDILECIGAEEGSDIADYLCMNVDGTYQNYLTVAQVELFGKQEEIKPAVKAALDLYNLDEHPILDKFKKRNPAIGTLIEELDLDTDNIRIKTIDHEQE